MKARRKKGSIYVASPAIAVPISLAACYKAWLEARHGKRPSVNQLVFDVRWLDRLLDVKAALCAGEWQPARTVSFVVTHPKTREIHAPDFADRIVHHILVRRLEKLYEPIFIHDSYANRTGKGTHAAVDRLQKFMRSRSGTGWYLQLDIHNYFNSINRHILYRMICHRLAQCEQRKKLSTSHMMAIRSLCHKLLANKVNEKVRDPVAAAQVPPHKRLANAAPGCGLPVGNLTSQFFANVYLNALDQFVKHTLKCTHYIRYVDDFVLLADDAEQLREWQRKISNFLAENLCLKFKDEVITQPLSQGIDFLGFRVFAHYRRVRPRVVAHCRAKLYAWEALHIRQGKSGTLLSVLGITCAKDTNSSGHTYAMFINFKLDALAKLQALLGSYWGHFSHANSWRLRQALFDQFKWLKTLFEIDAAGKLLPRWVLLGETFSQQAAMLQSTWPTAICFIQKGNRWLSITHPNQIFDLDSLRQLFGKLRRQGIAYVCACQTGWIRQGLRRREIGEWYSPNTAIV